MVTTAASVEWTVVRTEVEALQLEYTWIKEFDPRFNVKYRDDKSYPSLAVTLYEEYPRLQVMRGPKRKGVRYFGPYSHAWAIRETLDLLLRVFPARTCSAGVFKRAGQVGRPCLLGYIGKCSAPVRRPGQRRRAPRDRRRLLRLHGRPHRHDDAAAREGRCSAASENLEFERAARLRDDLGALQRALEKQAVVFGDGTDADVVAFAEDDLEAAVQVFHVRGGRVRGQRGWVVDKLGRHVDRRSGRAVHHAVLRHASSDDGSDIPREVLVPVLPDDDGVLAEWLSERRGSPGRRSGCRSAATSGRWPRRSPATPRRRSTQHKLKRASDLTARSRALDELQEALELPDRAAAHRVLRHQPRAGHQRRGQHGRLRGRPGPQERVPALRAARHRRGHRRRRSGSPRSCAAASPATSTSRSPTARSRTAATRTPSSGADRGVAPGIDPTTGRPRKFAYAPNLLVVDGGAPQVAAAQAVLDDLGIDDVAARRAGQAAGGGVAARTSRTRRSCRAPSEALYLLQRVRDEAHRFAITYHRQKRSKAMTVSALDGIPGLGETRRKALMKRFGSLKRLRAAERRRHRRGPGHRAAHRRGHRRRAAPPTRRRPRPRST